MKRHALLSIIPLVFASSTAFTQESNTSKSIDTVLTPEQALRELGPETGLMAPELLYAGKTIKNVTMRYRGTGKTVVEARLLNMIATQPGTKYTPETVDKDLERLLKSGLVGGNTTVAVEADGDQVNVFFELATQNLLGGVGFKGNNRFEHWDLAEECGLKGGQAISDKALSEAINKLRTYYHDARYPDAQVSYHYQKTERPGYVDVIFNINEGKRANIINIDFIGNENIDSAALRQVMKTKEKGWLTWITKSGQIDREVVEDDLAELVTHYRNKGYLRAKLTKVQYLNHGDADDKKLTLQITVDEGKRYKVNKIVFGPTSVFTAEELVPGLSMYDGDYYSGKKVADDITMLRRYYGSRGYADAEIIPDIQEVGTDKNGYGLINVTYKITEGSPYRVGNIRLTGNVSTKDYVVRQELPLQSNDPLNSVDLETAQKRIENLGYFDMVDVSQTASERAGYRDVNIEVREKRTGMVNFGLAVSSVESVYLFSSVTQSNFDLFDWSTFKGGGQRFTVDARIGTETRDAGIHWLDPWFLHRKLAFGTDVFYSDSSYYSDYYDQTNYGFAVSLREAIGELSSIKLEYRLEKFEIDPDGNAPLFFQEQEGDSLRSHIELSYLLDTRDAQITTRKGGKLELIAGYSGLGGDVKTYNFGVNGSYYWNLRGDTIFSINAGAATVDASNGEDVPIYERLYLGGPYNLRGFRFRDVAPFNTALSGDETMGGRTSLYCQFEYTIPIIEEVRFAVFYDIGVVNKDAFDFNTSNVASDWGIGLRLNLPIGPLAVDYAIPVKTGNAVDDDAQFQFYMNYSF
ncbi:MAG: outer membrane protein assembly factor BamA [Akkermansia sp.]|nr:outer membrane protein assembly factor BamA [Akkermansia sp.]